MLSKRVVSRLLSLILITLFVGYYASITLFSHTHTYAWGKVTHSHPYLPSSSHSHTSASLQTIESLSNLIVLAIFASITLSVSISAIIYKALPREAVVKISAGILRLRAPPLSY